MSAKGFARIVVIVGVVILVVLSLASGVGLRGVSTRLQPKKAPPPQAAQPIQEASTQFKVPEAEKTVEIKQLEGEIDASNKKIFELLEEYKR